MFFHSRPVLFVQFNNLFYLMNGIRQQTYSYTELQSSLRNVKITLYIGLKNGPKV